MTVAPDELLVDMAAREAAELEALLGKADRCSGRLAALALAKAGETAQRLARLEIAIALDGIAETARRMRERDARQAEVLARTAKELISDPRL